MPYLQDTGEASVVPTPRRVPSLAEGEHVGLDAWGVEPDLEAELRNRPGLSDELVHPRLGERARAGLVNVEPVRSTGRPPTSVASQPNTCTPLGTAISRLAAAKKVIVSCGSPTANMWCTQTPNPRNAIIIVASAIQVYATIGRRANVGTIEETIPTAGRKMM